MQENRLDEVLKIIESEGAELNLDKEMIEKEAVESSFMDTTLSIKIMSILGGFLGSLFFIGGISLSIFDSTVAKLLFGIFFITLSIWLYHEYKSLIVASLCISSYILSSILLFTAFNEIFNNENIASLFLILIILAIWHKNRDFIFPFFSQLIILTNLLLLPFFNDLANLTDFYILIALLLLTYLLFYEAKLIKKEGWLSRDYHASFSSLLIFLIANLFVKETVYSDYNWLLSLLIILLIAFLTEKVLKNLKLKSFKNYLAYLFLSGLSVPLIYAPTILASLFLILLFFFTAYKRAFQLAIILFVYFLSSYYYNLDFSLLDKSILLLIPGLVLLAFTFYIKRLRSRDV